MAKKRKASKIKKIIIAGIVLLLLLAIAAGYNFYNRFYLPNINYRAGEKNYLYVHTGGTFNDLVNNLKKNNIIIDTGSFAWVANYFHLQDNIHPGRYLLKPEMNNLQLVRLLKSGKQVPLELVLKKFRTKNDLVHFVSSQIEADSVSLDSVLDDTVFLRQYGFTPGNSIAVIIPNTYEFYWNTNAGKFFERIYVEYKKFWTDERVSEAADLGLTPIQVQTLASIIEEETNHNDEKPVIASVYLNRLNKKMNLEADPTVKYAIGDFSIKRISLEMTRFDSPYNTYKERGLPPGPICTPAVTTIDAVLHPAQTDYLYFCARPDSSGYHIFATTYSEQKKNARLYHIELNKRNIHS
jgi:UPF0755 protein